MKRFLGLVLLLTCLFCSCHTTPPAPPAAPDSTAAVESVELSSGEQTSTEEETSSVRYIREYEVTELQTCVSDARISIDNGIIYVDEFTQGRTQRTIIQPDGSSIIEKLPRTKELQIDRSQIPQGSISGEFFKPYNCYCIYPLQDGTFFVLGGHDMLIVDADGNTVKQEALPRDIADDMFRGINISEEADGQLHILVCYNRGLYYFDKSLTLKTTFDVNERFITNHIGFGEIVYHLGDGVYRFGQNMSAISIADAKDGSISVLRLKLASEDRADYLLNGANGALYMMDDTGIFRYYEDRQPEVLLRWDECGTVFERDDVFILDDNTLLYKHSDGLVSHLYLYRITRTAQTVTDKETITLLNHSLYTEDMLTNAVYQFNRTNEKYKINLVNDKTIKEEDRIAKIEQILLNGTGADMILPYAPEELFLYFDKNAFVDLNPYIGDKVFGCIRGLYGEGDAMYIVPMSFSFTTLIANTDVLNGKPLTWENFYAVRDSLPEDVELVVPRHDRVGFTTQDEQGNTVSITRRFDLPQTLYDLSVAEYADWNSQTAHYNTDAFRDMILCLQSMAETMDETVGGIENCAYIGQGRAGTAVSNGALINRLRGGGVAFAEVEFAEVEHFSLIQRLFGDGTSYEICGYPSSDGGSVAVRDVTTPLTVLECSPNKEGCIEFLEFLLSNEWQNNPDNSFLPVSPEALAARLEDQQYYYYRKYGINSLDKPGGGHITLQLPYTTKDYDDSFGDTEKTEDDYYVYSMTDEHRRALLNFFETIKIRTTADKKILSIVNEELSYWKNNARTLEETTKIIDGRVWIYLNE